VCEFDSFFAAQCDLKTEREREKERERVKDSEREEGIAKCARGRDCSDRFQFSLLLVATFVNSDANSDAGNGIDR